ncbi:hypothetical protein [Streptomyces sp. NPDC059868]|uniref:hypothetical protein n=1 Tax=unclassified Streptomyces TaxID=2593676 RepID=UPI00093A0E00|nr:hypothetical protein AMK31_32200 [Streptomyces sp. TSRI0107]
MSATSWLSAPDCDLDLFLALVERTTDPAEYSHAAAVERAAVREGAHVTVTGRRAGPGEARSAVVTDR